MEKKIRSKLKIVLITAGVLIACTAALIGGILIAGNAEENKIVKTAYLQETETDDTKMHNENSDSVLQVDTVQSNSNEKIQSNNTAKNESGISIDDAKNSYQTMFRLFFNSDAPKNHISASIDDATNAWLLGNKEGISYINSQTGEVIAFYNVRGYLGETIFSEEEFASYKENLINNHDKYIKNATSFIDKNFADGRNISEVVFDDVVFTGEPGKKGTFRLTLRVLMESGSSYCLMYTESPNNLERFFSYETERECLAGSSFENEPPTVYDIHLYTPEIVYDSEIGPEHLTVDEAMDIANELSETIFGKTLEKSMLSAYFRIIEKGISRSIWYICNDNISIGIDAITGNMISCSSFGTDAFTDIDSMPMTATIENDDEYFTKAQEVLIKYLGNDGKVDYMMIDGIQVIFDDYNNPVSYLVDCHVIMKKGPCYTIGFAGSDKMLWRIYSYDSEEALFNP